MISPAGVERVDRALALELPDDRVVAEAEGVREHVETPAVSHPDHYFVRAVLRGEPDRLVEHRHHHVEALDRKLLLAEEGTSQVLLERLDARQRREQLLPFPLRQRPPVLARLDRLPQPHALLVICDVLDLVRDGSAVRLAKSRQCVRKRLARNVEAQHGSRDARLELGCQPRDQPFWLERRIAGRLGSERIETCGQMSVHPVGLDERHGRRDGAEQLVGDGWLLDRSSSGRGRGSMVSVAGQLEQAAEPGMRRDDVAVPAFEQLAPFAWDGVGILEVVLEQGTGEARVQAVDVGHSVCCSNRATRADGS